MAHDAVTRGFMTRCRANWTLFSTLLAALAESGTPIARNISLRETSETLTGNTTGLGARPRWPELSDLPYEELVRRISVFVANQERKTVLDVPTLHSLFKEAGFDRSTIATHNYRGREFALVEAHKGRD